MKSILNHKMHSKTKVSMLTILLLFSIALPLLAIPAHAASTATLSPTSGPNGTFVSVSGTGFLASETESGSNTPIAVAIDGLQTKAVTFGLGSSFNLKTSATGVLSGWFQIGGATTLNLSPGTHSVQISDSIAAPIAVSFTITSPTVSVTPSSGPAGTSVSVSASGFAKSAGTGNPTLSPTNTIATATFAGTSITVASGQLTASAYVLSSNVISSGAYAGTVSLPAMTPAAGTAFTLTDAYGNVATVTFALNTPTVILSPTSGPVGTLITAACTGFGPGATFATTGVKVGATAISGNPLIPASPAVTEQGTAVFQFIASSTTSTPDYVGGGHTITVTDSSGNTASATFMITPKATVNLGTITAPVAPIAPLSTTAAMWISASGFAPSTKLSVTATSGVPQGWLTFVAASITTDANGQIAVPVASSTASSATTGPNVYQITISDGVNSPATSILTVEALPFFYLNPTSGAAGTVVSVYGFDTSAIALSSTGSFSGSPLTITGGTTGVWGTTAAVAGTFIVPSSGAGFHVVGVSDTSSLGTAGFSTTSTTAITIVSPSSAAPGTTITIVGSGFANPATTVTFAIDGVTYSPAYFAFTQGSLLATFLVPNILVGVHSLLAADSAGNTGFASFTLVAPTITVSPAAGPVGTSISITGSGFKAGELITASFDGVVFGSGTAAATGVAVTTGCTAFNTNGGIITYSGVKLLTNGVPAGSHTITVAGTSAGNTASFTFTITPTLTLNPVAVRQGAYSLITGNGFAASSTISMTVNGTSTSFYNPTTQTSYTSASTDASGNILTASNYNILVPSTSASGPLTITVTDASGNTKSATLTVLLTPAITLNPTQVVAGSPAAVTISGVGFSIASGRLATAKLTSSAGADVTSYITLLQSTVSISSISPGTFSSPGESFNVALGLAAGTYTLALTLGAVSPVPAESASTTLTITGVPTVVITPTTAASGSNVTITITGLAPPQLAGSNPAVYPITTAQIGSTSYPITLGNPNVPTTGTSAYTLTTWFLVPSGLTAGAYTLTVGDGTRSATTTITIMPSITVTPYYTNIPQVKGNYETLTGSGFAPNSVFTATINGIPILLQSGSAGTTYSDGTITTYFYIPATATLTNTVTVTDAIGNTASTTLNLTKPTLILTPTSGTVGSTMQIIGTGFQYYEETSAIVIQINGNVVVTSPAQVYVNYYTGQFIAYVIIPAGLSGNVTVSATDQWNNVGNATFAVTTGGPTGFTVDQATLSATAQTLNQAGQPSTSIPRGQTVKVNFVLDSTAGSGSVVWRIQLSQGTAVYNIATTTAAISTTATTLSFTQLIPTGISAGTWTASIQIFASDGVTGLGVATLTFNVT